VKNILDQCQWVFEDTKCHAHIDNEAVVDLFKWDETVAYDEEAQYVGRIRREDEGGVQLETLLTPYWQYTSKKLVEEKKAEMLALRRTFDNASNMKEWAEHRWGPICPMLAYQLNKLGKYIKKMLGQGKIVDSEFPYRAPILFVPKPDGSL